MLFNREFVSLKDDCHILQVLHWNMLSDQLSGFFPSVDEKYLDWSHRKPLISSELLNSDADILCLSEVDHFDDFVQPLLAAKGYHSIFKRKKSWHRDGLCIAYKADKLRLVSFQPIYFPKSNQFALTALLSIGTIEILVITTHLKSGGNYERDRETQIKFLLKVIAGWNAKKIILCGDFNCEPGSLTYNAVVNHKIGFQSSYCGYLQKDCEPEITTYKKREDEEEYKTIDYIFVKGFVVTGVLKLPGLKEVSKIGMPSKVYPSDHLSLMCRVGIDFKPSI